MATLGDVFGLGYFSIRTRDLDAWRKFATGVLGASIVPDSGPDRIRLRLDEHAWRIEIVAGADDELPVVGWQVPNLPALESITHRIDAYGISTSGIDSAGTRDRGIVAGVQFTDPNGIPIELFVAPEMPPERFVSPTGARFITGSLGLGHLVFRVAQYQRSVDFYQRAMGFGVSDVLTMGTSHLTFFHCNARHHSLALASDESVSRFLHFMVEVDSLDDVGFAFDRCERLGAELVKTIGRHSNDRMVSFYVRTPGAFELEYGWGGRVIDPSTWSSAQIVAPSIWGHRLLVDQR